MDVIKWGSAIAMVRQSCATWAEFFTAVVGCSDARKYFFMSENDHFYGWKKRFQNRLTYQPRGQ